MHYLILGFSFGGLLASYVMGKLWEVPLISAQSLLSNVLCIMFGAPLTPLASLEIIVNESPKILQSLHSFYLKDDYVPKILRFLDLTILSHQKTLHNEVMTDRLQKYSYFI